MTKIPDNIEDTVLDIKTGASGLPLGDIEMGHLARRGLRRCEFNFLVNGGQESIVDLESDSVEFSLVFKERGRS